MPDCKIRTANSHLPRLHQPHPTAEVRPPADMMNARSDSLRILRLPQVLDVTGLGKTKIYELQAAGHFPMRVQITTHSVGWVEAEVQAWLAHRVARSISLPAAEVVDSPAVHRSGAARPKAR